MLKPSACGLDQRSLGNGLLVIRIFDRRITTKEHNGNSALCALDERRDGIRDSRPMGNCNYANLACGRGVTKRHQHRARLVNCRDVSTFKFTYIVINNKNIGIPHETIECFDTMVPKGMGNSSVYRHSLGHLILSCDENVLRYKSTRCGAGLQSPEIISFIRQV